MGKSRKSDWPAVLSPFARWGAAARILIKIQPMWQRSAMSSLNRRQRIYKARR